MHVNFKRSQINKIKHALQFCRHQNDYYRFVLRQFKFRQMEWYPTQTKHHNIRNNTFITYGPRNAYNVISNTLSIQLTVMLDVKITDEIQFDIFSPENHTSNRSYAFKTSFSHLDNIRAHMQIRVNYHS